MGQYLLNFRDVHNIFGRMGQLNIWFLRMRKKERIFFWIKHLVFEKEKNIFFLDNTTAK